MHLHDGAMLRRAVDACSSPTSATPHLCLLSLQLRVQGIRLATRAGAAGGSCPLLAALLGQAVVGIWRHLHGETHGRGGRAHMSNPFPVRCALGAQPGALDHNS